MKACCQFFLVWNLSNFSNSPTPGKTWDNFPNIYFLTSCFGCKEHVWETCPVGLLGQHASKERDYWCQRRVGEGCVRSTCSVVFTNTCALGAIWKAWLDSRVFSCCGTSGSADDWECHSAVQLVTGNTSDLILQVSISYIKNGRIMIYSVMLYASPQEKAWCLPLLYPQFLKQVKFYSNFYWKGLVLFPTKNFIIHAHPSFLWLQDLSVNIVCLSIAS